MPDQTPYVPFGLTEAVDIFFIQQLKDLLQFYTNQQGEPLRNSVDVKAIYAKLERSTYPVIALMTTCDTYEPVVIGDLLEVKDDGSPIATFSIYNVDVNLHIEAIELRELARLRDFIYVNFDKGRHPLNQFPWLHWFINNGIEIISWENSTPTRVAAQSLQQRTSRAQGPETEERTDIETLWSQECCIHCRTQVTVTFEEANGVITSVNFQFTQQI